MGSPPRERAELAGSWPLIGASETALATPRAHQRQTFKYYGVRDEQIVTLSPNLAISSKRLVFTSFEALTTLQHLSRCPDPALFVTTIALLIEGSQKYVSSFKMRSPIQTNILSNLRFDDTGPINLGWARLQAFGNYLMDRTVGAYQSRRSISSHA